MEEKTPLVSVIVPFYNGEKYADALIKSFSAQTFRDFELIAVNDGSTDGTGETADEYERNYPGRVIAHHQENGGHGEGVNTGIRLASGKYYKVVDSDDSLDADALKALISSLKELESAGTPVDMFVCNYVYVRCDTGKRRPMNYKNVFPEKRIFKWEESRPFGPSQYLMMHSVVYRTALLRDHHVELPAHTFYVDNLYMYAPFPYVERMYYLDEDLYLYSVGREEQSVSDKNVLKRIDQQVKVTKLMIGCHELTAVRAKSPRLYRYMLHELAMMMSICGVFLEMKDTAESLDELNKLWEHLKERDPGAYKKIRFFSIAALTRLPGKAGRKLTVAMYRAVRRVYKFN